MNAHRHGVADLGSADGSVGGVLIPLAPITEWLRDEVKWPGALALRSARIRRVWPTRSGLVNFELILALGSADQSLQLPLQGGLTDARCTESQHAVATVRRNMLRGLRLQNDDLGVWVCTPDRDPIVPAANEVLDPHRVGGILSAVLPRPRGRAESVTDRSFTVHLAAYRARRRCVVRVDCSSQGHSDHFFIKAYRRLPRALQGDLAAHLGPAVASASGSKVGFSGPLLVDAKRKTAVTASVGHNGAQLEYTGSSLHLAALAAVTLHGIKLDQSPDLATHTVQDELATVTRWAAVGPRLLPHEDLDPFTRVVAELRDRASGVEGDGQTIVHRDYYHAQLMYDGHKVWVLDLDTLCVGDPEVDVATYTAHQMLHCLQHSTSASHSPGFEPCFLDEYLAHNGELHTGRLRFYLSCALARLGILHRARGVPRTVVDTLWSCASTLLDQSTDVRESILRPLHPALAGNS